MFGSFPLFLDGEQKKDGDRTPRGKRFKRGPRRGLEREKTRNNRLGEGTEQTFADLIAHILGHVTSNHGSGLADYTAFEEILYYRLCGMSF